MIYDAKNGYGLKFTKFDDQYQDCIIYRDSRAKIIELADKILISFGRKGLMEMLNEMQAEAYIMIRCLVCQRKSVKSHAGITSMIFRAISLTCC